MVKSNAEEKADGAGRVESFGCPSCGLTTRSVCNLIREIDSRRCWVFAVIARRRMCTVSQA